MAHLVTITLPDASTVDFPLLSLQQAQTMGGRTYITIELGDWPAELDAPTHDYVIETSTDDPGDNPAAFTGALVKHERLWDPLDGYSTRIGFYHTT